MSDSYYITLPRIQIFFFFFRMVGLVLHTTNVKDQTYVDEVAPSVKRFQNKQKSSCKFKTS
jgi:hypothetical protein